MDLFSLTRKMRINIVIFLFSLQHSINLFLSCGIALVNIVLKFKQPMDLEYLIYFEAVNAKNGNIFISFKTCFLKLIKHQIIRR